MQNRALRVPGGSLVGVVGTLGSSHRRHEVEAGYFAGRTERRSGCDMHTYVASLECGRRGERPSASLDTYVCRYHMYVHIICMSISYVSSHVDAGTARMLAPKPNRTAGMRQLAVDGHLCMNVCILPRMQLDVRNVAVYYIHTSWVHGFTPGISRVE